MINNNAIKHRFEILDVIAFFYSKTYLKRIIRYEDKMLYLFL